MKKFLIKKKIRKKRQIILDKNLSNLKKYKASYLILKKIQTIYKKKHQLMS